MSTPSLTSDPNQRDNAYQDALARVQLGDWPGAIAILEDLVAADKSDRRARALLADAKFRAEFEEGSKIRARRWSFPLRRVLIPVVTVLLLGLMVWLGSQVLTRGIAPLLAAQQQRADDTQLLNRAQELLAGGAWDEAEAAFQEYLARVPDDSAALDGLARIDQERELEALYDEALAIHNGGDCPAALAAYGRITVVRAEYRDVQERVRQCRQTLDAAEILETANYHYQLGIMDIARDYYEQVRALDAEYKADFVKGQLYKINLYLGRQLLQGGTVDRKVISAALEYFAAALQMKPRDEEAGVERMLAKSYLDGEDAVARQDWERAAGILRIAYEERPDYLNGILVEPLYEAYVGLGDFYNGEEDCALAYEHYRRAAQLPAGDTTLALARMDASAACLTPTPTPTDTPLPTGTPVPSVTPTPSPTPRPLALFRNKIVFKSDNPDRPGFYAMNPDGSGREYVGDLGDGGLQAQVDAMIVNHRESPDGQSYIYVDNVDGRAQVVIHVPPHPVHGELPDRPLTRLTGIAYDPVWSPDGSLIAFVTQENESDDIWVIRPDSSGQRALMRNLWEWDKHPTWSPDGTRIAFFSNREGTMQIFIMDANGQGQTNISNVPWDEYDPVWIR